MWSTSDVGIWVEWLCRHFALAELDMHQFRLSGQELCTLNRQDFQKRSSDFVAGIMYAYLGRLKEGEPQVVVWGEGEGGGEGSELMYVL